MSARQRVTRKPPSRGAPDVDRKLADYRRKRDPARTREPFEPGKGDGLFVVQKHAARRLHYDFRLAIGGVLVSWAVPKGPCTDPRERRLAVHVEDHPLSYKDFEGTIPEGEYGAGSVIVWDTGPFRLRQGSVASGSLKVDLAGKKLVGGWALVRMNRGKDEWLLIKEKDGYEDPRRKITDQEPESVLSGLTVEEIGSQKGARQWNSGLRRMIEELPEGAAREAPLPRHLDFTKARLLAEIPAGKGWLFEIKLDGVRTQAVRKGGNVRLVTRNRKEVAFRYPEVASALEELQAGDFIMDGEIVALDEEGRSRFELLQGRIHLGGDERIASAAEAVPIYYYAFDLLYAEGFRLEEVPLLDRKRLLRKLLERAPRRLRFSDHVETKGPEFLELACQRGLEGVIAKRADSAYRGTRSGDWVKVKCLNSQEFVIGGFTPPRGGRSHFGSLLLGLYEGDRLVYAGKVGTGFSEKLLADVHRRLKKLVRERPPFADPPRERGARWVEPKLVGEVRFTEWTSDGKLRHPSFAGLREDKNPRECVREVPAKAAAGASEGKRSPRGAASKRIQPGHTPAKAARTEPPSKKGNPAKPAKAARRTGAPSKKGKPAKPGSAQASRSAAAPSARGRKKRVGRRASGTARHVEITNPSKVFYPRSGITKGEVAAYYGEMAATILPYLEDRPLTLVRFPNGIEESSFFQKDQPDWLPDWVPTVTIYSPEAKRDVDYILCNDRPTLAYIANLGTIDLHPWASRVGALERPDYVVWDLDPPEGGYGKAVAIAPRVRGVLEEVGLTPFLKTSGGKGLHVYVPLVAENDHAAVRDFAEVVARIVVEGNPRTTTLERSKARRAGKVYVDFLQNGRGKTVVAPYSLRAKEPATVSMPLTWEELESGAEPGDFTLRTVPEIVADRGDAWRGFWDAAASLKVTLPRLRQT